MTANFTIKAAALGKPYSRCRLCSVQLGSSPDDDLDLGVCGDCRVTFPGKVAELASRPPKSRRDREFTASDKTLIARLAGKVPDSTLLQLINARLADDLGAEVQPFTMDELLPLLPAVAAPGDSWLSIRRLLSKANRDGTLAQVTPQVIADFAVVFSLTPGQLMRLKDLLDGVSGGRNRD